MARGESVGYFGATDSSPYWQISAREYAERWIHHLQLRRAVQAPDLVASSLSFPAMDAVILSVISRLGPRRVPPDTSMTIEVTGVRTWTAKCAATGWELFVGDIGDADLQVDIDPGEAPKVLSQGCTEAELRDRVHVLGDVDIAERIHALLAR